jgi:SAM-dependent methyltransferase
LPARASAGSLLQTTTFGDYVKVGRVEEMAQHLLQIRGRVTSEFLPDKGRILEIGAGEATFDRKGCEYIGINVSRRGSPTVLGDGQALPFRDAAFDGVIATEVIEHVRHPYRLLREIRRVLRPDGHLLLSTPNVAIPANRIAMAVFGLFPDDRTLHEDPDVGHIHFFTRRFLLEAVAREGFRIVREWDFLLQFGSRRYLWDTPLERTLRNHAKQIMLDLVPR